MASVEYVLRKYAITDSYHAYTHPFLIKPPPRTAWGEFAQSRQKPNDRACTVYLPSMTLVSFLLKFPPNCLTNPAQSLKSEISYLSHGDSSSHEKAPHHAEEIRRRP
jgi:hypothetical protein